MSQRPTRSARRSLRTGAVTEDGVTKSKARTAMMAEYLDSEPTVTDRLITGTPARDIKIKRAEVQARLDEWQAAFGPSAALNEWQRLLDMARTYTMVEEVMRRMDQDLRQ